MRNMLDFSSWHTLLTTALGLLLASLLMVGIRLVFMQTIQRRQQRENRQINERLKTLIAAYKTLGGSFTGQLQVSPAHMRDLRRPAANPMSSLASAEGDPATGEEALAPLTSTQRQRRVRDAVEAALSDVILLGTEEQVQLAAQAAQDMVAGRSIETAQLVVSLRQFIRAALDLEPIAQHLPIPVQGPLRPGGSGGAGARRANADGGVRGSGGGAGVDMGAGGSGMGVATHPPGGDPADNEGPATSAASGR
ncbi:hypothetical protein AVMA1855_11305 [Acidovorax sp. SUPP1855]|uniref:hypothetical protein n=1 Tax=Acidovorax sp. SUPP1855 TaxID=431774 RepID=UPI0023DE4E4E|nr:hypothetical protein [Acidovorax sp. SUPP1855]GKS84735.1 hypothetical protein AVMA1855_11305 [Acidovorax sp. SUPP1855]